MREGPLIRTVRDALGWAERQVSQDREPPGRSEMDRTLAGILGIPSHEIYLSPDRKLSSQDVERFQASWHRRLTGVPLQHLLGEVEFFSLAFRVVPGVFIPRPETECLVETVLRQRRGRRETWIDVGTGAGVIAVSLAVSVEDLTVIAADVSTDALDLARENARRHGVEGRVRLVRCDALDAFRRTGWADGIVSNPPYVSLPDMRDLPVEVRDHDPHAALFGGPDGLAFIRRLAAAAPEILRPGGRLAFEMGERQADDVRALLEKSSPWDRIRVREDLAGRPRVALARRSSC